MPNMFSTCPASNLRNTSPQTNPAEKIDKIMTVGSVVEGVVSELTLSGAVISFNNGLDGFLSIIQYSDNPFKRMGDTLKKGNRIKVKIISIDTETQKLNLSIKAITSEKPQILNFQAGI